MKLIIGFLILNFREHFLSVCFNSGIGRHSRSQPLEAEDEDTKDAKLLNFNGESAIFLDSYDPIFDDGYLSKKLFESVLWKIVFFFSKNLENYYVLCDSLESCFWWVPILARMSFGDRVFSRRCSDLRKGL